MKWLVLSSNSQIAFFSLSNPGLTPFAGCCDIRCALLIGCLIRARESSEPSKGQLRYKCTPVSAFTLAFHVKRIQDGTITMENGSTSTKVVQNAAESLLGHKTLIDAQCGWPTSSNRNRSILSMALIIGFDLFLLACSSAFFAFALVVYFLDQAPTTEHPRTTEILMNATKYVSAYHRLKSSRLIS